MYLPIAIFPAYLCIQCTNFKQKIIKRLFGSPIYLISFSLRRVFNVWIVQKILDTQQNLKLNKMYYIAGHIYTSIQMRIYEVHLNVQSFSVMSSGCFYDPDPLKFKTITRIRTRLNLSQIPGSS